MRKVNYFLFACVLGFSALFVGCGGEDDPIDPVITVNINGTNQLNATIAEADLADLVVIVDYTTGPKITKIEFDRINGTGLTGYPKVSGFAGPSIDKITLKAADLGITAAGEYSYITKVTDNDNGSANRTINITVTAPADNSETFEVTLGGPKAADAGSFLSIKDKKAYKVGDITSKTNNVEIVFDGTKFMSAKEAANVNVKENGHSATITGTASPFSFTTSTGYTGTLTVTGEMSGDAAVIEVEVKRTPTAE